ncbi:[Pyruvate dehydrogenase [acetyl-transferring]]-phosphatase 1, mitochondrial, partial [Orchesella cincta]
ATAILRSNEHTEDLNLGSVKSFDTNQLPSNSPVEDARAEARCLLTTGMIFGVFDGHGGPACGQVVAKRLLDYVAASLLPKDVLEKIANENLISNVLFDLLEPYNDRFDVVEDLYSLYVKSFEKYIEHLIQNQQDEFVMEKALVSAFVHLDEDISKEARSGKPQPRKDNIGLISAQLNDLESLYSKTLSVALSGAVACVTHVDKEHLHVASCGDCRAVLGVWNSDTETWVAQPLSTEHNSENAAEVSRIIAEHPEQERETVIRNDRLLGLLAPLRAFGDVRFKWTTEEVRRYVSPFLGEQSVILSSLTPPYLTARPDVFYHKLRPKDHFLILATDGLWDLLSPSQAVRLVGEHMSGKTVLRPFSLPSNTPMKLKDIHKTLMSRMESHKLKPNDANAATHLIRHALGGTEHGIDHERISQLLTLPEDAVRLFRDDITVTVLFFNTDFLSTRPL